ncbi:MAG: cytochrome bc1 complex diheme cytochrome c subunit [Sporichthyaceae bacterium]
MKRLSARRRHPWAAVVVLLMALGVVGAGYAAFAPSGDAEAAGGAASLTVEEGKSLFITSCSSCHGLNAEGTSDGPSLIGVGAAAVDFQVGTGRMPMQSKTAQAPIKPRVFNEEETQAMAAYVASLAPGPAIPTEDQYAPDGDMQEGGEIFRTNCASCHNFAGNGGALTRGKYAVSLQDTSRKHLYEAMLTGPQAMPVFNDGALTPEQKKDVITYLKAMQAEPDIGGNSLGRIGPVTEGLLAWTIVIGVLIGFTIWLGAKAS